MLIALRRVGSALTVAAALLAVALFMGYALGPIFFGGMP